MVCQFASFSKENTTCGFLQAANYEALIQFLTNVAASSQSSKPK
jgi:hypothetical protein